MYWYIISGGRQGHTTVRTKVPSLITLQKVWGFCWGIVMNLWHRTASSPMLLAMIASSYCTWNLSRTRDPIFTPRVLEPSKEIIVNERVAVTQSHLLKCQGCLRFFILAPHNTSQKQHLLMCHYLATHLSVIPATSHSATILVLLWISLPFMPSTLHLHANAATCLLQQSLRLSLSKSLIIYTCWYLHINLFEMDPFALVAMGSLLLNFKPWPKKQLLWPWMTGLSSSNPLLEPTQIKNVTLCEQGMRMPTQNWPLRGSSPSPAWCASGRIPSGEKHPRRPWAQKSQTCDRGPQWHTYLHPCRGCTGTSSAAAGKATQQFGRRCPAWSHCRRSEDFAEGLWWTCGTGQPAHRCCSPWSQVAK